MPLTSFKPEVLSARILFLEGELERLVAERETEHMRAWRRWMFEILPWDRNAPYNPPNTLDLDVHIHDVLDELEEIADQQEQQTS